MALTAERFSFAEFKSGDCMTSPNCLKPRLHININKFSSYPKERSVSPNINQLMRHLSQIFIDEVT
jgi:hypothetical protein